MNRAFTLVELSIVLVILGLLTGGILAGQTLIRAAELRSVGTEYQRHQTAVSAFRDKYFAFPGDMNNAVSFWGAAHATPATCRTTAGTGTQTCNGNADSMINTAGGLSDEYFRFWQHLANAGLIEGSYTGLRDGASSLAATANNSPRSKLQGGLWFAYQYGTLAGGGGNYFAGSYGNALELGAQGTDQPATAFVKPDEVWNLDVKIDDGKPATGKLWIRCSAGGGVTACTTAATDATTTGDYRMTVTANNASYIFPQAF